MKLPKLCLPTFNGDPLKWGVFWEQFHTTVHDNAQLDNHQKLTYLREVIKDSKASHLLNRPTTTAHQYDELVTLIKERYDQKCLVHKHHTTTIVDYPAIKQGTYEEFCTFSDTIEHSINYLKDAKQYDIGSFIASILTTKLPKRLNDQWLHFTRDTPNVPDVGTLLEFIKEKRNTTSPLHLPLQPKQNHLKSPAEDHLELLSITYNQICHPENNKISAQLVERKDILSTSATSLRPCPWTPSSIM